MSTQSENVEKAQEIQWGLLDGIKRNTGWAIAIGVISIIAGFMAVWTPFIAGLSVAVVVGSLLVVTGVSQLYFAFKTGSVGQGLLIFVLGLLAVAVGFYMAFRPVFGLMSLTLVLAAYFAVSGVTEIIAAFKMKGAAGWIWALFSAAASILLGIMIWWQFPLSGFWAVGILTGIRMIFGGSWLITIASGIRGAAKAEEEVPA